MRDGLRASHCRKQAEHAGPHTLFLLSTRHEPSLSAFCFTSSIPSQSHLILSHLACGGGHEDEPARSGVALHRPSQRVLRVAAQQVHVVEDEDWQGGGEGARRRGSARKQRPGSAKMSLQTGDVRGREGGGAVPHGSAGALHRGPGLKGETGRGGEEHTRES